MDNDRHAANGGGGPRTLHFAVVFCGWDGFCAYAKDSSDKTPRCDFTFRTHNYRHRCPKTHKKWVTSPNFKQTHPGGIKPF